MKDRRVALITGGTGYIGSSLVRKLISSQWEVHVIVRARSSLDALASVEEQACLYIHDGSTEGLMHIMEEVKPEVVFHLASLFLAQHSPKDVAPLIQSNILFATQLAEAMAQNQIRNLVNTGTSWQHYENKIYSPVNLYAATKQAFEAILQFYIEAKSFRVVTLELFDTYGPNDPRPKLFPLLRKISNSRESLAMSPGEQMIDMVHIDDVTQAYLVAAQRLLNSQVLQHECYGVSSGHPIKLRKLIEIYEEFTETKLPIQWGARPYREREVMTTWNQARILDEWRITTSLEAGIRKLAKENGKLS